MTGRYAVYFAPARGSLWQAFGSRWLGRDEFTGEALPQPLGAAPDHAGLTAEPRRYGFHATLKAPFRAACSPGELLEQVDALAAKLRQVPLGRLDPVFLDGFLALVPAAKPPGLEALAARCVKELDRLRAPLAAEERARRRPELLDARGRELLDQWGFPFVLERFRFHMTLTGPLPAARAPAVAAALALQLAELHRDEPPVLDRLCVFHEPAPGELFLRVHDAPLAP